MAGIPTGMQNPVRTSTGGVAFAQPLAVSFNPYGIKTDEVEKANIMRSSLFDSSALGTDRSGSIGNDFNPIGRARLIGSPLASENAVPGWHCLLSRVAAFNLDCVT